MKEEARDSSLKFKDEAYKYQVQKSRAHSRHKVGEP